MLAATTATSITLSATPFWKVALSATRPRGLSVELYDGELEGGARSWISHQRPVLCRISCDSERYSEPHMWNFGGGLRGYRKMQTAIAVSIVVLAVSRIEMQDAKS